MLLLHLFLAFLFKRSADSSVQYGQAADEDLYRRYAEGDDRAFAVLLDRWGGRVVGYLTRYFGDRDMAEDLTQEVFLKVIAAAADFRGESSFRTFLFRIVRNLCIDVVRARSVRPDLAAASLDGTAGDDPDGRLLAEVLPGDSPAGDQRTLSGELSEAFLRGLTALPEEQREVFLMREVEGLKFREIADVLRVNENTVKSRMHYAVLGLREALDGFRERP